MKMRKILAVFFLTASVFCGNVTQRSAPNEEILAVYREFSKLTDPGEYAHLYEGLPESLQDLCSLIKCQLIHPIELGELKNILPEERHYEDPDFPTVREMLAGLIRHDDRGLHRGRKPEHRLIVACYHHAMLLASILRYRGIPVRIRTGFARYYEKEAGVRFGHAICEVWDEMEERWIRVDPDRKFVDIDRNRFELSGKAWKRLRRGRADPGKYMAAASRGDHSFLHILILDVSCVVMEERLYWDEPPVLLEKISRIGGLDPEKLAVFDRMAELLDYPDDNFESLKALYGAHDYLRPAGRSFEAWYEAMGGEE
jgi:hypothetical protein